MKSIQFWEWYADYAEPRLKNAFLNRVNTFRRMLEYVDELEGPPCIIETGCIETVDEDGWVGNGCSTIIFDKYVSFNHGRLFSVDIVPEKVDAARKLVSSYTNIGLGDSVEFLQRLDVRPGLVYLDASHLHWHNQTPSQVHHYRELMAIMPRLRPETLVVVDDSPAIIDEQVKYSIQGKGGLVGSYANEVGAELLFTEYQSGWVGFPGRTTNTEDDLDSLIAKARDYIEKGKWIEAYNPYRAILARTPQPWTPKARVMHGEACAYFARLARKADRIGTAHDWYERALKADPRATEYRMELVNKVLGPMRIVVGAREQAEVCTRVSPEDPLVWRSLGVMEGELGNMKKSLAAHKKQVELSDRSVLSLLDLIATLLDSEQYDEAEILCDEVINHREQKLVGDAYECKALLLARLDKHEEAIPLYEKALENQCSDPTLTHFHLSLSLHSIGRYKEAWNHHAKRVGNRTNAALYLPMRRFNKPLFENQPAPAVIHVHAEAGSGDNFALWRYIPLLAQRGYTVRYEARNELLKLARDSLPGIEVMPYALDWPGVIGIRDFDYHCPIGELPHIFGTEVDTVPWNGPYIKADPEIAKRYRHAPKIGIAWSSGIRDFSGMTWLKRYGQLKSLGFELVKGIFESIPGQFVSLQVGPPRGENDLIADLLPEDPSWAETAGLIENLDLVITPDTGLAHLAGAMGKPTWVMMHKYNAGWHFMCERPDAPWNERSPWYPSVRLFRQRDDTWGSVTHAIAWELISRSMRAA
jgi:tetratricopeptide (TPR) repeat protein